MKYLLAAAIISTSIVSAKAQDALGPGTADYLTWGAPYALPFACIGGNLLYMFHVANVEQRKWTRMDQEAMNAGCFFPGVGHAAARARWQGKKPEYMHNVTK